MMKVVFILVAALGGFARAQTDDVKPIVIQEPVTRARQVCPGDGYRLWMKRQVSLKSVGASGALVEFVYGAWFRWDGYGPVYDAQALVGCFKADPNAPAEARAKGRSR